MLAPDGDLARLPFEVLPAAGGGRVIDSYEISYLTVGRDLLGADRPIGEPGPPLVIADPDFDLAADALTTEEMDPHGPVSRDLDRSGLRFARLPGTRVEGEQVAGLLGVQPWMEAAALDGSLKTCRSPQILHLATHGFFLEDQQPDPAHGVDVAAISGVNGRELGRLTTALENPLLRSGLALAGVNAWMRRASLPAEAEDGILTAEDVSGLDLIATELVVLSACDTGLGEIRAGEGVLGLRRAFTLAGARTLVMSLWKVPDEQTQELMVEFYRRIHKGESRVKALREAQLALRERYADPLYWGAFICEGDPGPLPVMSGRA